MSIRSSDFLRRVLLLDAVASGAMGAMLLLLAKPAAAVLDLPAAMLSEAGLVLLPFAAFVGFLASRQTPARAAVWVVIALNALWALDSVVLLFTGWIEPNAFGSAFIVGQALIVAVLGELEYIGLRRSSVLAT